MDVYIGADHNGFAMKKYLLDELKKSGFNVYDEGDRVMQPDDDFPQFAARTIEAMKASDNPMTKGILICGSGQGMCMAANRYKGIRASLVWDVEEAHASRNDDDSNVLCLPARFLNNTDALKITEAWLATPFAGAPRFQRRIKQLDEIN